MHGAGSLPPNAARISKIFCAQPCNRPSLQIQIFPRSEETKPLRSTPIDIIPSFIPRINFSFLSENRERMDTLSSQTTPIPAILSLYRLQMFSFARLISFVHPLFLLFNARVSISTLFLFITSVDTHFYLMKLSSTDEKLSFTRTRLLFAGGLGAGCTATPNVVRVSSDRMSDRRARDAGLDQRLASPGERTANLHPLLTIRF